MPPLTPSPPSKQMTPNYSFSYNQQTPKMPTKFSSQEGHQPSSAFGLKTRKERLLQPQRRTNPLIWCGAFICIIFSLLVIFAGIVTLIVFLGIKPKNPTFDATAASLNSIYLDSPTYLNNDFTFLANFTNPNNKIDLMFQYMTLELYFGDKLISSQALQPFVQKRGESRLESVHLLSSEVYLPPELALKLQQQVMSNRVVYNIRGALKVRASLGIGHYSYWLYTRCQLELTAPPNGVLVARSCRTKK